MDLSLLPKLRCASSYCGRRNFSEVSDYFFSHFGQKIPAFIALGEQVEDEFLEQVIRQVGGQLFAGQIVLNHLLMTRLPDQGFIHGGFAINGRLGNVIYFEEARVGLLSIVISITPSETKMVRFTGQPVGNNWKRSDN